MTRFDSARLHAIILTHNRTDALERCVDTALRKLKGRDILTVLDDSTAAVAEQNANLLAAVARKSPAMITHLMPARLFDRIAEVTGASALEWRYRIAPRDIAPLRNLALLLSVAVRARTTILIDDDICGFDLELTHRSFGQLVSGSRGLVVGAEIGGRSEMDTLTQLHDALQQLESEANNHNAPIDKLFCKAGGSHNTGNVNCGWVSAGYMAFNICPTQLFAFPPGYNEDWLWCLMHHIGGEVRVLRSEQIVQHAPPTLRRATRANIRFELAGDLIFESLCAYRDGEQRTPLATLFALAQHVPCAEVLPTSCVAEVINLARALRSNRRMWSCLNHHGLTALEAVTSMGSLHLSEKTILPDWCEDTIAKHRSFSALPANEAVQSVMAAMAVEGRK